MYIFKTALLVGMFLLVAANDQTKPRGKRQQITYYPRRGGRPPPYAVQMEPIPQYSQRDPLYNPSAHPKSDDQLYHDDPTSFNHYSNDPEPIIEIIIKESNETLPPAPRPPTVPQPRPTKEPIQVFYVKYEKKKGHGDSQPRVIYDTPIPALTPVEEHEEIKTGSVDEHTEDDSHLYATEAPAPEPSTTLRAIIRPESEVYHSGSSGIRVTFGTEQIPPNNHSKRSDSAAGPSTNSSPAPQTSSVTSLPPPGSPKRQHGPYHNIQPSFPRVPPAFPQQRIVNSFSSQQQLPPNFPGPHQQFQSQPNGPINPPRIQQQRPPITIQNLPEIQQRLPFQQPFGPPHRISINHPQQPGFPPALSISHQNVHLQNQPPSLVSAGNFNGNIQQRPNPQRPYSQQLLPQQQQQQQQQLQQQSYKDQELEKQRYHQEQRRQQELRYREQQRLQEQQRQQEQQKHQDQQRKLEEQRIIEQQRQADHQRQQERQRQEEQLRIQEQQKYHLEQQHRKQEQENRLLHEQQTRQQFKFGNSQPTINPVYNQQQQQSRPGGEILKAVPKLEQHYAIRENPLHPGPFPPNPQVQPIQYPETGPSQFSQLSSSASPDVHQQQQHQQQYFTRNPTNNVNTVSSQQQQQQIRQQHNSLANHENYQSNQQSFFAQNLPSPQQQRIASSPQKSIWGRPVFQDNDKQKIYATPVSNSNDLGISSTARTVYHSTTTTPVPTTTTQAPTTTEAPTTAAPKNEEKIKANIANLPDEVPDDIREQLLSSGILGNADIQILDYDKVGGINIENLPPEALANFYGAGGGAATAASEPIPAIAKRPKTVGNSASSSQYPKKATFTKVEHATLRPGGVEMKVVHFDPNTAQGQAIADQHIREDATHLKPVTVGTTRTDPQYNRYLPLKVSGTSFPIPDAPELRGRKISSVVVLAPVDYSAFRDGEHNENGDSRQSRVLGGPQPVKFLAGDSLKQLVKKPSAENYKKWLEQESRTEPQRQSVVLLVTTPQNDSQGDKEIFMYDVSSQSVSKLAGDLSSAFVNAAESNSDSSDTIDDSAFTTY